MKNIFTIILLLVGTMIYSQNDPFSSLLEAHQCETIIIDGNENTTFITPVHHPLYLADADNDGIPDKVEGDEDTDNDGIPNYLDPDSDGDGVNDGIDVCPTVAALPPSGCPPNESFRKVWWIHGYQGNELALTMPGRDVGGIELNGDPSGRFKARSYYPDYNVDQTSLQDAANNVNFDIRSNIDVSTDTERNFIIAHSMGGLVSRKLGRLEDSNGTPLYDGLITFGSPHQGAHAANTLVYNEEDIHATIFEMTSSLSAGPFAEGLHEFSPYLNLLGGNFITNYVVDQATNLGLGFILDLALKGVEEELTTDAVASLPPMATSHNAVFYGIEDGKHDGSTTARFFGAIANSPNSYPLYGADISDQEGMNDFEMAYNDYLTNYNIWQEANTPWWSWFSPTNALVNELSINKVADGYKKGMIWFYTLNPTWMELIGARESYLSYECTCYFEGNYGNERIPVCTGPCETVSCDRCDFIEGDYVTHITYKESDGFILAESAMNAPGLTYDPEFMPGSNHMQMKNDKNMEVAVDKIFIHGLGGSYFQTDER